MIRDELGKNQYNYYGMYVDCKMLKCFYKLHWQKASNRSINQAERSEAMERMAYIRNLFGLKKKFLTDPV